MKFTRNLLSSKNQSGIAILIAVLCVVMISYIVTEITYETSIEFAIHSQAINRMKAYYAARSGVEMSLLRIKIYQKIQAQFGSQLGSQAGMLNMIWSFPLNWPPEMPGEVSAVEKDLVKDKVKESKMDSTFVTTITDEGSKIDLNDLDSPSKALRASTKQQLLKIFENKITNDRDWANAHSNFRAEELVNNIIDWEDADTVSLNGGDERHLYPNPPPDITNWPPNRSFRTLDEVRMVAGMTDDIFDFLKPMITIYGAKSINPNTTTREVLQSFDISMTDAVVTEILKRRDDQEQGGPFASASDFWNFVNAHGGRVDKAVEDSLPLSFGAVTNFRIQSIGEYKGSIREIDVIVFDFDGATSTISAAVKKDVAPGGATPPAAPAAPAAPTTPAAGTSQKQTTSKGPPRIVYWFEK